MKLVKKYKAASAIDHKALFEALPDLYLILTPDLTITAASDAYLNATMTSREKIIGHGLFNVFSNNSDDVPVIGINNLKSSLARVLEYKIPDRMILQKYYISRPEGGFEERYWSPVNSPVLDKDNEIVYIIHRVEDVTGFVQLKHQSEKHVKENMELRINVRKMECEFFKRIQEVAGRDMAKFKEKDPNEVL